jgi:hypothetical protein
MLCVTHRSDPTSPAYSYDEEVISTLTDLSQMNAAWGLGRDSTDDRTTAKEWSQRFSPKHRRRYRMKGMVAPFDEQNPSKRPRKSDTTSATI